MTSKSSTSDRRTPTWEKVPKEDLLDRFHPDRKVCEIVGTTPGQRLDPFYIYRPRPKQYLDYSISQTEAKMDCGPTKIHYMEISAVYEPFPDDYVPEEPPKKRKRPQHGRGPVWLYLDEIYKRKIEKLQDRYRTEMEERLQRKAELARTEKLRQYRMLRQKEKARKRQPQMKQAK